MKDKTFRKIMDLKVAINTLLLVLITTCLLENYFHVPNMNLYLLHLKTVLENNFFRVDTHFCNPASVCLVVDWH